jgi:hypothetical protein
MNPQPLLQARAAAEQLKAELGRYCDRIEIAGSIRRGAPMVKDIELVAIGLTGKEPIPGQLFESRPFDYLERFLETTVSAAKHRSLVRPKMRGDRKAPWGTRYKWLWWTFERVTYPVDLFQVTRETFAPQLVIRTGPAEFSKRLVMQLGHGGAMPTCMRQHEGRLEKVTGWDNLAGQNIWTPLDTPDEAAYFHLLSIPHWLPHERSEQRLIDHLKSRGLFVAPRQQSVKRTTRAIYSPFRKESRGCSY